MEFTSELINLNLEQIQYLIDFVNEDIRCEKINYERGLGRYARKGLPTQKQCQDHNAKAMQQHAVIKQLYVIAQYTVLTEAKFNPSIFGKAGSELCKEDLCDEKEMKLTKDQRDLIVHALEREIDLERMSDEEIIEFAKEENGVDTDYIIKLQEIVDLFQKQKEKSNAND